MSQCDTYCPLPAWGPGRAGTPRAGSRGWGSRWRARSCRGARPGWWAPGRPPGNWAEEQLQSPEKPPPSRLNGLLVDAAGSNQRLVINATAGISATWLLKQCWTYTYVQRVTPANVRDQHNLLVKRTTTHTHTHTAWERRKKNTQVHLVTGRRYSSKPSILQQCIQIGGANE